MDPPKLKYTNTCKKKRCIRLIKVSQARWILIRQEKSLKDKKDWKDLVAKILDNKM